MTHLRIPMISASAAVLATLLVAKSLAAQPVQAERAHVPARIEIDRSTLAIDVASQRRVLDVSIRRALAQAPTPRRVEEELRIVTSEPRPTG